LQLQVVQVEHKQQVPQVAQAVAVVLIHQLSAVLLQQLIMQVEQALQAKVMLVQLLVTLQPLLVVEAVVREQLQQMLTMVLME
jgi:hypothetical protein